MTDKGFEKYCREGDTFLSCLRISLLHQVLIRAMSTLLSEASPPLARVLTGGNICAVLTWHCALTTMLNSTGSSASSSLTCFPSADARAQPVCRPGTTSLPRTKFPPSFSATVQNHLLQKRSFLQYMPVIPQASDQPKSTLLPEGTCVITVFIWMWPG